MQKSNLADEWALLQNQFDSYEKFSLLIKLANITLMSCAIFFKIFNIYLLFILMIIWLLDGIWKTFQSRIETRLLIVEEYFSKGSLHESKILPYQFNRQFMQHRPGGITLIKEYVRQALRPTVAYPHFFLLLIMAYNTYL